MPGMLPETPLRLVPEEQEPEHAQEHEHTQEQQGVPNWNKLKLNQYYINTNSYNIRISYV